MSLLLVGAVVIIAIPYIPLPMQQDAPPPETEMQPDVTPETQPDSVPETQPETQPDVTPETQADAVPEVVPADTQESLPAEQQDTYVRVTHEWYSMDIPAGWVLQHNDPFTETVLDMMVLDVSGGRFGGSISHTYTGHISQHIIPPSMSVGAVGTALQLDELVALEAETISMFGDVYGLDVQYLGSSAATLGSVPGVMSEYAMGMGQIGSLHTWAVTAVLDGVAYSVTITAVGEDGLMHLKRAAESFEAVPAGLPDYVTITASHGMRPPGMAAGIVTGVVDGDTLDISGERYRFVLVDTPERGEPGFAEAAVEVERLCPVGSTILHDDDGITPLDAYDRRLGVVWCEGDGYETSVGERLYVLGLAEFRYGFCDTAEAATAEWAAGNGWFYHDMCAGR